MAMAAGTEAGTERHRKQRSPQMSAGGARANGGADPTGALRHFSGAGAERVPPHNLDAEQGLLASILLEGGGDILDECQQQKFTPEFFFLPAHQAIFASMCEIKKKAGAVVEEIALGEHLQSQGRLEEVGGRAYITAMSDRIDVTVGYQNWMEIVREKYFRRKIIRTAIAANESAHTDSDSLNHLLDNVERSFLEITQERITGETLQEIDGPVGEALALIETLHDNKGAITGVPTGFKTLDRMCFGFHPGQMIVVAARPGMGKTSIALNFIEAALFSRKGTISEGSAARKPRPTPTLMFSLEMPARELAMRLLCSRARARLGKIRDGFTNREESERIAEAAMEYKGTPLLIDDQGGQTILEIRAKARRIVHKFRNDPVHGPLGLIVIDYLQLINGTDNRVSREQQIAEASRSIKAMAKEFNLPVIALAQLNRKSEDENRAPRISDLRESGSIEQDADMVLLIDRKRKTGAGTKRKHGGGNAGEAEEEPEETVGNDPDVVARTLIIAKQRNGPTGEIDLHFHRALTRFEAAAQF
jgi:replicative DNA helicase